MCERIFRSYMVDADILHSLPNSFTLFRNTGSKFSEIGKIQNRRYSFTSLAATDVSSAQWNFTYRFVPY